MVGASYDGGDIQLRVRPGFMLAARLEKDVSFVKSRSLLLVSLIFLAKGVQLNVGGGYQYLRAGKRIADDTRAKGGAFVMRGAPILHWSIVNFYKSCS